MSAGSMRLISIEDAPSDLDLTELDCREPERQDARRTIEAAVPPRAVHMASRVLNRSFVVTDAIRALAAWRVDRDENGAPEGYESGIVVLAGPPGTGKTTAVAWFALNRLVDDVRGGVDFHWYSAGDLARMKRTGEERDELLGAASKLLVIDDLGAESVTGPRAEDWRADFDELIDAVYRSMFGIALITTNLTAQQFRKRYGSRVVDRLRECGTWIAVEGESMRGKRAERLGR